MLSNFAKNLLLWGLIGSLFVLNACGSDKKHRSNCRSCHDFSTQSQAKSYAQAHPECKRVLDSDRDGKYCEDLPK
jgi:hypothetical protein